ncbi:putative calcium uptake protein/3 [Helianthus anomalus]
MASEEFKKVLALMQSHNRQGVINKRGHRTGLRVGGCVENGRLVHFFFGEDGNQRLQHDKFVQFLRDLHDEMIWLEFSLCKWDLVHIGNELGFFSS